MIISTTLDSVKRQVQSLYKTNPVIHVNIAMQHPKLCLKNVQATITGVYPHIFQIEENSGAEKPARHTIQYAQLLTNNVEILELNDL